MVGIGIDTPLVSCSRHSYCFCCARKVLGTRSVGLEDYFFGRDDGLVARIGIGWLVASLRRGRAEDSFISSER